MSAGDPAIDRGGVGPGVFGQSAKQEQGEQISGAVRIAGPLGQRVPRRRVPRSDARQRRPQVRDEFG